MAKLKSLLAALLMLGVLTACEDYKPCIDGDDFGMPKITLEGAGIQIEGEVDKEVSQWKDTELVVDGTPLIFQVYNRWNPVLKGNQHVLTFPCRFTETVDPLDSDNEGYKIDLDSWPCFMAKGMGVYGLLMDTDVSTGSADAVHGNFEPIPDPNRNYLFRKSPPGGNSFHLGDPNLWGLFPPPITFDILSDPGGGVMPNKPVSPGGPTDPDLLHGTLNYVGDTDSVPYERLYFKILDSYYTDNTGAVVVKIRSGARSPYPGIFESMILAISDVFMTTAETIYRRLTENTGFIAAVQGMLIIYVAIYGLTYVMGMVSAEASQKVFLTKIIKFGIIGMLISPFSFEFFDQYLLNIFVHGMYQMINIVSGAVAGAGMATNERMTFFDDVLNKLFSEETQIKIISLLWFPSHSDWLSIPNPKGIIFIPVLYILIILFVVALFKALLVFLMALITLALLIALAPIFIPFLLFEKTKNLFDGWMKAMIGHWLQPIMIFGMLTLFYIILMEMLYKTIGYRTCWDVWWSGELWPDSPFDFIPGDLRAWMPNVRDKWETILVPPFYYIDYSTFVTSNPDFHPGSGAHVNMFLDIPDYLLGAQNRLVDYPALDPGDPVDADKIKDAIDGTVTSFYDVLIFGIVIYLMYIFSSSVQGIAREIAGITFGGPIERGGSALWSQITHRGAQALYLAKHGAQLLTSDGRGGAGAGARAGGGAMARRSGVSVTPALGGGADSGSKWVSAQPSALSTGGVTAGAGGGAGGAGAAAVTGRAAPIIGVHRAAEAAGKPDAADLKGKGRAESMIGSHRQQAMDTKTTAGTDVATGGAKRSSISNSGFTAEQVAAQHSKPLPPTPAKKTDGSADKKDTSIKGMMTKAAGDAKNFVGNIPGNIAHSASELKKDVETAARRTLDNAKSAADQAMKDTRSSAEKAVDDAKQSAKEAAGKVINPMLDAQRTIVNAPDRIVESAKEMKESVSKAVDDASRTVVKGILGMDSDKYKSPDSSNAGTPGGGDAGRPTVAPSLPPVAPSMPSAGEGAGSSISGTPSSGPSKPESERAGATKTGTPSDDLHDVAGDRKKDEPKDKEKDKPKEKEDPDAGRKKDGAAPDRPKEPERSKKDNSLEQQSKLAMAQNALLVAKARLNSMKPEDPGYNAAKLAVETAERAVDAVKKSNPDSE